MDTIRSTDFATLDQMTQPPQTVTLPTTTIEGVPYTMVQYTHWVRKNDTGAAAGPCQSPPTAANPLAYIAVTTTVTWNDMHGVLPVQTQTVISPPVGVYDQTEGHIRVTVLNASGQPVSGALVSIANPTQGVTDSATTGTDGCAFFAYQPTGAYTVTLSSAVGQGGRPGKLVTDADGDREVRLDQQRAVPVRHGRLARAHVDAEDVRIPDPDGRRIRRAVDSEGVSGQHGSYSLRQGVVRNAHRYSHARSRRCSRTQPDSKRGPGPAPMPTRKE